MASTLIVRDATLAINGGPGSGIDPREHMRDRIAEVHSMDLETLADCAEVLRSVGTSEEADLEVLRAMTILGLAHPTESDQLGVSALASGRRLVHRMEQSGDIDDAMAVLELLLEVFPSQGSLERDLTSLMRRQGMVTDLMDRYYERAQRLLREGKTHEAMGWLREILLLDGSRKDVARLIRNLRLRKRSRPRLQLGWIKGVVLIAGLITGVAFLVMRERSLRMEFQGLPAAQEGNFASMRARLADLETFVDEHPVWHGAIFVLQERADLRVEVGRLQQEADLRRQAEESALREREESANLVRARARGRIEAGDFPGALEDLRLALELAPAGWVHRERVKTDIQAVVEYMEENQ